MRPGKRLVDILHSENYQTMVNLMTDCEDFLQILLNEEIEKVQDLFI